MAGIRYEELNSAKTESEATSFVDTAPLKAIAAFAHRFTSGKDSLDNYQELSDALGGLCRARCVRALCWFLRWGGRGGNTIDRSLDSFASRLTLSPGNGNVIFEALFLAYYMPLFLVVTVLNAVLRVFPTDGPIIFNVLISLLLPLVTSAWIIPVGVLGGLSAPLFMLVKED